MVLTSSPEALCTIYTVHTHTSIITILSVLQYTGVYLWICVCEHVFPTWNGISDCFFPHYLSRSSLSYKKQWIWKGWRWTHTSSKTLYASQPHLFDHKKCSTKAPQSTMRTVLSVLFHIQELTDSPDLLVLQWFWEERHILSFLSQFAWP